MKKDLTNRQKRHYRVRSKIKGSVTRPRLSIFRSNKHIYAQIIDDENGNTIFGASTKSLKLKSGNKSEQAKKLGEFIGKGAMEKKVKEVVFDRGGYKYHGRVKSVADGARENGLVF